MYRRIKMSIMPDYRIVMPCGADIVGTWKVVDKKTNLDYPVFRSRKGGHKCGSRLDVWFRILGCVWWGTRYGESEICYCKKIKEKKEHKNETMGSDNKRS